MRCLAPLALVGLLATPASADLAAARTDLARLQHAVGELRAVQLAQADPGRLAAVELRLNQIEEELRRLTGRIEEAENHQRGIGQRVERLIADVDRRLAALENGTVGAPPTARQPAEAPAPAVAAEPRPRPVEPGPELAPDERPLGTIPREALLGLPLPGDQPAPAGPIEGERDLAALGPEARYNTALNLLRAGDYAGAEQAFEAVLELEPEGELAANAAYWIAETHYVRRDYASAAAQFARNFSTYGPDAPRAADNLLKLGMSLHALDDRERACQTYAELQRRYPNAPTPIQQTLARERNRAGC